MSTANGITHASQPTLAAAIEPLLSPSDIARTLRCTRRCLEQLRAAGRFPSPDVKVGRLPRWRPETVREWIAGGGSAQ
jgi:hypothetical protein